MTTGKRIAKARKEKGLSQEQLGEKLGVTFQAVSSWERDEYLPETKNLAALSEALDVSLDSLLAGEERNWELKPVNFDPDRMFTRVKTVAQANKLYQSLRVLEIIKEAHKSQIRQSKHGFEVAYYTHPVTMACHAMAMGLMDDDVIAACLAHDMVEDTPMKLSDLPVGERVREAVRLVSKNLYDHTEGWEETYFAEIRKNPLACLVKCLDRVNNLAGMADAFSRKKMVRYTEETDRYYPDLLEVIKKQPEWNDAWWLLRYQMVGMTETFKRLL